jgi:hypothetical protein
MIVKFEYLSIRLLAIIFVFCLLAIFISDLGGDERDFHMPNAKNISFDHVLNPNSEYSSAYTPLPYFLGNAALKVFDSIISLRLLNYIVVLGLAFFIYRLASIYTTLPKTITLIAMANPYILRSAFLYHLSSYGLLLIVIGLYVLFASNNRYKYAIVHFFWASAILAQQWMLIIIPAHFLYELMSKQFHDGQHFSIKRMAKSLSAKILAIGPYIVLVFFWSGFTHPNFQAHSVQVSMEHLTGVLANWGFLIGVIVLFSLRTKWKYHYFLLIYALPVLFLSAPVHAAKHGLYQITGIPVQIATQIERYLYVPYEITVAILALLGLMACLMILQEKTTDLKLLLASTLIGFFVVFSISAKLGSSHIFVSAPFLMLYFADEILKNKTVTRLIIIQHFTLAVTYIIYSSLFVTKGLSL